MSFEPEELLSNSVGNLKVKIRSQRTGEEFDVTSEVRMITIRESIYEYHLFGSLELYDVINLREELPLIGEETVTISWEKERMPFKVVMHIGGINKIRYEEQVQIIDCYITTEQEVLNEVKSFSKAYQGPISSIVRDIYLDQFDRTFFKIEKTLGSFAYNVPSIKPFEAIDHLMKNAHNASNSPMFLYQLIGRTAVSRDPDQLRFESLETMMNSSPVAKYYYTKTTSKDPGEPLTSRMTGELNTNRIFKMDPGYQFNTLNLINNGVMTSTQDSYDIGTKVIKNYNYTYKDIPSNYFRDLKVRDRSIMKEKGIQWPTRRKNSLAYKNTNTNLETVNEDIPPKLLAQYNEAGAIQLSLDMNSHRKVAAGRMLEIFVPSTTNKQEPGKKILWDQILSGTYLMAEVTHQITLTQYQVGVKAIKNKVG